MLLHSNLKFSSVFRISGKDVILMLSLCTITYFVDAYLLTKVNVPGTVPVLLGTAIAFFIGFNNTRAYERWWEARIIWGALVNDSRSWTRGLLEYTRPSLEDGLDEETLKEIRERMIYRHIGFMYALKASLRKDADLEHEKYMPKEEWEVVSQRSNVPDAILHFQSKDLEYLSQHNSIEGFRFQFFNLLIQNFTDGMGKSERIHNTVFPASYIYFTTIFIWVYVGLVTMSISHEIGPVSILFSWVIGIVFYITHTNGLHLLNPFRGKPEGIPLDSITRTIEINLLEALGQENIPAPVQSVNQEYIM
jgi:putative membrane protein